MTVLAFIPARGGSKGIPEKNIALLNGRPLIAYTIDVALALGERVIPFVSTDDEEIAAVCDRHGLANAYRRPESLATDEASIAAAVLDACDWLYRTQDVDVLTVMLLQPTSPFRDDTSVLAALNRFEADGLESLVGVNHMREHPTECIAWRGGFDWEYVIEPQPHHTARQLYDDHYYFIDGSLYIASVNFIRAHGSFVARQHTAPFDMMTEHPIDVDTPTDLEIANALLQNASNNGE